LSKALRKINIVSVYGDCTIRETGEFLMSRLNQLAINDEGFVFDPSTGESFTLNPTGLAILKAMKEQKTSREIAEELQEHFESGSKTIQGKMIFFKEKEVQFSLSYLT
jgi:hypothetical protein